MRAFAASITNRVGLTRAVGFGRQHRLRNSAAVMRRPLGRLRSQLRACFLRLRVDRRHCGVSTDTSPRLIPGGEAGSLAVRPPGLLEEHLRHGHLDADATGADVTSTDADVTSTDVSTIWVIGITAWGLAVRSVAIAFALMFGAGNANADDFACRVSSITDGDTFRCDDDTRIRIHGIDAREMDTAQGPASRDALQLLIEGHTVACQQKGTSYNRIVATCLLEGQNIAADLPPLTGPVSMLYQRLLRCSPSLDRRWVEFSGKAAFAAKAGADFVQGFLFARPAPIEEHCKPWAHDRHIRAMPRVSDKRGKARIRT